MEKFYYLNEIKISYEDFIYLDKQSILELLSQFELVKDDKAELKFEGLGFKYVGKRKSSSKPE